MSKILYKILPGFIKKRIFTIPVTIFKKRGDTFVAYWDYGKKEGWISKKSGISRLYLGQEKTYAPYSNKFIRGDGSIIYIETGNKDFVPVNITLTKSDMKELRVFEEDIVSAKAAITQQIRENINTIHEPTWWEKYGNAVLPVVYFFVMGLVVVIVMRETGSITAGLAGVADKISQLADKVGMMMGSVP